MPKKSPRLKTERSANMPLAQSSNTKGLIRAKPARIVVGSLKRKTEHTGGIYCSKKWAGLKDKLKWEGLGNRDESSCGSFWF